MLKRHFVHPIGCRQPRKHSVRTSKLNAETPVKKKTNRETGQGVCVGVCEWVCWCVVTPVWVWVCVWMFTGARGRRVPLELQPRCPGHLLHSPQSPPPPPPKGQAGRWAITESAER